MPSIQPSPITASALYALPDPATISHKGKAGRVLIIGGCERYTGAPHLAGMGALRSGAGLVTIAAPSALIPRILGPSPDLMALPLHEASWSTACVPWLDEFAAGCDAVALGPGLGRGNGQTDLVAAFLACERRPPCVIDADALYALHISGCFSLLSAHDVCTPHPGEAATLLTTEVKSIQEAREQSLDALCGLAPCVWLLKGAETLIGQGLEQRHILPYEEPNLAVGGSGDVLSGCIAAYLAQKVPALSAANAGALTHAHAGHLLRGSFPARGNTASDIAATLPQARAALLQR